MVPAQKKMAFLCVSQQGKFKKQKRHKKLLGGSPCQKLLAKKNEKKTLFPCRLFPSIFFNRVFGRFSAWGAQKHYLKCQKISKKGTTAPTSLPPPPPLRRPLWPGALLQDLPRKTGEAVALEA
jgi:hypothetical protein